MRNDQTDPSTLALGAAVATGAGIGTALFAGSDNPVWIGLGAGLGVVAWSVWQRLSRDH